VNTTLQVYVVAHMATPNNSVPGKKLKWIVTTSCCTFAPLLSSSNL